jgi:hypothetical protein
MPVPDPNSSQVLTTALTEQEAALIVNHLDALGSEPRLGETMQLPASQRCPMSESASGRLT